MSSKIVFVTSGIAAGFAGAESVDSYCQGRADIANLPGTYAAWISDGDSSPQTRFNHSSAPYLLLNDALVANNWDDLIDGNIANSIDIDEFGEPVEGDCTNTAVWTGTNPNGAYAVAADCDGWSTLEGTAAIIGSAGQSDAGWTYEGCPERACDDGARVYCFEQ